MWAVDGLTIRNSTFRNCDQFDVFLQKLPGGAAATPTQHPDREQLHGLLRDSGYFSIRLADHAGTSWRNVTIRNNSMDKAPNLDARVPYSNVKVLNNIAPALSLYTGVDGRRGLAAGRRDRRLQRLVRGRASAAAHDQVAAHGYRNLATGDFHLNTGAAAINRGDPLNSPSHRHRRTSPTPRHRPRRRRRRSRLTPLAAAPARSRRGPRAPLTRKPRRPPGA